METTDEQAYLSQSGPDQAAQLVRKALQSGWFLCFLVLAALTVGHVTILELQEPIGDEAVHAFQIGWFVQGTYQQFEYVTVVPLYHAASALLASLTGHDSLVFLRTYNLLLASLALVAFWWLARFCQPDEAVLRSALFLFLAH